VVRLEVAIGAGMRTPAARQALGLALLLGTAAALGAAGLLALRRDRSARAPEAALQRRLDRLDGFVNLLLVPLCVGVLGLYAWVEQFARRFAG
jgi:hypothetical protein